MVEGVFGQEKVIKERDVVIIYEDGENFKMVTMEKDKDYQCRYGKFEFNNIINQKKFGDKIYSKNGKGWAYLIRPNTDFYTDALKHRT